jgi:hypothetical protein
MVKTEKVAWDFTLRSGDTWCVTLGSGIHEVSLLDQEGMKYHSEIMGTWHFTMKAGDARSFILRSETHEISLWNHKIHDVSLRSGRHELSLWNQKRMNYTLRWYFTMKSRDTWNFIMTLGAHEISLWNHRVHDVSVRSGMHELSFWNQGIYEGSR